MNLLEKCCISSRLKVNMAYLNTICYIAVQSCDFFLSVSIKNSNIEHKPFIFVKCLEFHAVEIPHVFQFDGWHSSGGSSSFHWNVGFDSNSSNNGVRHDGVLMYLNCSILYDKMKSNSACLILIFIRILVVMGAKQVWFLYLFHWSLYSFCIDSCMEDFVSTAATVADFWSLLPRPTSIRSFCGPIPENTGGRSYICTES